MTRTLTIDVVSDVMCPWCYIGKRRLETALAERPDVAVRVSWRPFQLDATIPPEGMDRRLYLERKFGSGDRGPVYARIAAAGEGEGIPFAFDRIARSPNTLDAHRLIRWAEKAGVQDQVIERLFRLYFIEGEDIGNRDVLVSVAGECGMDAARVAELLAGDADRETVEQEVASAHASGITGVPCFIIDKSYAVMGAQAPSVIVSAMDKALEEAEA